MKTRRIIAMLLALAMLCCLGACRTTEEPPVESPGTETPTGQPPEENHPPVVSDPVEDPTEGPTEKPIEDGVRLAVLSGPTGIGAAKLLASADAGASLNHYEYTIAADNAEVTAGIVSAEPVFDIAAVASNVALNLYNKTEGEVKIIALGTQGVLHILEGSGGTMIETVADLEGETVYCAGQGANPEYILRYLLGEYGLDPNEDVTIVFAEAAEIQAKLLSGEVKYAMLPVPAATAVILKSEGQVRSAIDVTRAWERMGTGSQLIMTAVVARTAFIEEQPQAVADFLKEYADSIEYVNQNPEEAAELIAGYGITPSAEIARSAIPQCNLIFISGRSMAAAISDYFMVLYEVDPASVGGRLPDDAIYYVP